MLRLPNIARNDKGYLLLEVIVAVAILSLGLVMLLRCFAAPLRAVRMSESHLTATLLLEEKTEELQTACMLRSKAESGTFPGYSGEFKWKIETSPYRDNSQDSDKLSELRVTVSWREGETEHSIHSISLVVQR
jgi:general secretion pathway protein I